jgi:hypothetical protein
MAQQIEGGDRHDDHGVRSGVVVRVTGETVKFHLPLME